MKCFVCGKEAGEDSGGICDRCERNNSRAAEDRAAERMFERRRG